MHSGRQTTARGVRFRARFAIRWPQADERLVAFEAIRKLAHLNVTLLLIGFVLIAAKISALALRFRRAACCSTDSAFLKSEEAWPVSRAANYRDSSLHAHKNTETDA